MRMVASPQPRRRPTYHWKALGHGQQADRLAGRRGVDDDPVEVALLGLLVHVEQADHFLHAGDDGHFFRHGLAHALFAQHVAQVALHLPPVLAHLVQDIDLLGEQIGGNLQRLAAQRDVQAVGQAVGDVGTHDQGAKPQLCAEDGGCGSSRRLAYAALARDTE